MSEDTTEEHPTHERVGFRDIYRAVGESEQRILSRLDEIVRPLVNDLTDHEARIRVIEQEAAGLRSASFAYARDLANAARDASWAKEQVEALAAREGGILSTLGAGKAAIIIGMAIMGTTIALVELAARVFP